MPRTPLERISLSFNFDLNFAKKMPLDFKYRKYNYINRLSQASDWKSLYKVNGMTLEVENFADLLAYVENLALFLYFPGACPRQAGFQHLIIPALPPGSSPPDRRPIMGKANLFRHIFCFKNIG